MKKLIVLMSLISVSAFANDGGIAAIKVDQIKMREIGLKDGQEVILKKIVNPSYKIIIEGGEAAKLQKILPSQVSVITSMVPSIKKDFDQTFKSLGIYSDKSAAASSKVLTISCSDGEFNSNYDKIIKTGKSVCTITINGLTEEDASAADYFGDAQKFEPKTCN
jgi:hypothetical protein